MLDKLKNALDKSVASVSVKSGVFLETSKASTHISNIQNSIAEIKRNMADTVYLKWKDGVSSQDTVDAACAAIAKYEAQIAELQTKIAQLKYDSQQILGETTVEYHCPACGAVNSPGAKFCYSCGGRLLEEG